MSESNAQRKCRTCLKNTKTTFPLNKLAIGINTNATYGQVLKEYTKLGSSLEYEHLMPQYLCLLCCRQLSNTYNFIQQAQYCNNKLVNIITKRLASLQEKPIILSNIKIENDCDTSYKLNEFRTVNPNVLLKSENLDETSENERSIQYLIEDIDDGENNEKDLPMECSNSDTTDTTNLIDNATESHNNTICPICNKIINNNLKTHMRIQHDIEIPNTILNKKMSIQQKNQTIKYNYLNHIEDKHSKVKQKPKNKVIQCNSCDYTARTYSALNFHRRSKHGSEEDKFKCKFCPYTSWKKFSLLKHVKNSHKELIRNLKANVENNADQRDSTINAYGTDFQLQTTANDANLLRENKDYSSDENTYLAQNLAVANDKTDIEEDMFIRNILNIRKRRTHSIPSTLLPRRCNECGNIYNNLRALKTHQKNVHISEDKYFICPHCGKKLKRGCNLRIHIKNAHGPKITSDIVKSSTTETKPKEKQFMCNACSYVCGALNSLQIHIKRHHTGEKPYKCDICFKSFIVKYELKLHRYLHTGERPSKCPICSKGFRCNYQMIKHKRIHNNERPYKCKDCDKSFTQSYNLSLHKRIHLKEKKLNCKICNKLFENQTLLNMHCINENHHDEVV